jgi:hypothetical protein
MYFGWVVISVVTLIKKQKTQLINICIIYIYIYESSNYSNDSQY